MGKMKHLRKGNKMEKEIIEACKKAGPDNSLPNSHMRSGAILKLNEKVDALITEINLDYYWIAKKVTIGLFNDYCAAVLEDEARRRAEEVRNEQKTRDATLKSLKDMAGEFSLPPKNLDEYLTRKLKIDYNLSPIKKKKANKKRKKQSSSSAKSGNVKTKGDSVDSTVETSTVLDLTAENQQSKDEDNVDPPASKKQRGDTIDQVVKSPQRGNSPILNIKNTVNSSENGKSNLNQNNLSCSNVLLPPHPPSIQIQSPPPVFAGYNNMAVSPMEMDMT